MSAPSTPADGWDPAQYRRFAAERRQPFVDLLALCRPVSGKVVDLGCGTGELTVEVHQALGAARTVGVDSSAAMLAQARRAGEGVPGLSFVEGDLGRFGPDDGPVDVVFSNAALHWVGDHPRLLGRLRSTLAAGGQLAFQVPANFSHPSHVVARRVAAEAPFAEALAARPPEDRGAALLSPPGYAELLHGLGAGEPRVRLEVYGHLLDGPEAVVEWVKGSLLTPYREVLTPELYRVFLARYTEALAEALGPVRPYFYAFPRILCWAQF